MSKRNRKAIIDDGMTPELIYGASPCDFDGILQIPIVRSPIDLPDFDFIVPFSERERKNVDKARSLLCFHEYDPNFSDILIAPDKYVEEFEQYVAIVTPDCSLYWNAPLAAQITNHYRMNAIGYYYQHLGVNVIPLVRWGDERTYTTKCFPEKIAFKGYDKHGIYAIAPYGVIKTRAEKYHFKNGLKEMIKELEPKIIVVYGAMPNEVFGEFLSITRFVHFPDWTSFMKKGVQ